MKPKSFGLIPRESIHGCVCIESYAEKPRNHILPTWYFFGFTRTALDCTARLAGRTFKPRRRLVLTQQINSCLSRKRITPLSRSPRHEHLTQMIRTNPSLEPIKMRIRLRWSVLGKHNIYSLSAVVIQM